jgi:hypothetical protein
MMAVLDLCEELRLLPRAVRSRARSRLASAGLLVLPDEFSEGATEEGMDEDPGVDPLMTDLIETAGTAIADEDSAAAAVPLIFRGPAEYLDKIQHITFVDPVATNPETERELHVIQRIGQGLDMPPEVIKGMADANHWSAWQISDSMWEGHLQPLVEQMCGDLTSAYLAPLTAGGDYRVWYDAAELVTKPDRSEDAQQAHDRLVISDATLRESMGWDDDDAPKPDELNRRIGVKLGDFGAAMGGEPTGAGAAPSEPDEPPAGPGNVDEGPPETEDGGEAAVTAGAVRVALARCREAAGARVLTRLQREPASTRPDLRGVDRASVCATLGQQAIDDLGLEPSALVAGATGCFRAAGFDEVQAFAVETHAARTLFEAEPAPLR